MSENTLAAISESIRQTLIAKTAARDSAITISRELIRYCSMSIRASHRDDWAEAERLLSEAQRVADDMLSRVQGYPELLFAGYTQDAIKELVEANVTLAIAQGLPFPEPAAISTRGVEYAAYLNGLAEAAGELRRRALDKMRAGHNAESERLLAAMDDIYDVLVTMDFPDAVTGGLRRNTDMVRGVLERTRSDLTTSFLEGELKKSINQLRAEMKPDP